MASSIYCTIPLTFLMMGLVHSLQSAKDKGMEWWTARQINTWERARRQLEWNLFQDTDQGFELNFSSSKELPEATLLFFMNPCQKINVNGVEQETQSVQRWGISFQSITVDIKEKSQTTIEIKTR